MNEVSIKGPQWEKILEKFSQISQYMPLIIGEALPPYGGYSLNADASIVTEFRYLIITPETPPSTFFSISS